MKNLSGLLVLLAVLLLPLTGAAQEEPSDIALEIDSADVDVMGGGQAPLISLRRLKAAHTRPSC